MKEPLAVKRVTVALTVLAALSAILHIRAEYFGPVYQIYIFKPLTMLCIIFIARLAREAVSARYKTLVIVGLLFSLAGDVFLMLPVDMFIAGLVSFLIAHLFYLAAFGAGHWRRLSWWSPWLFVIYGVIIFALLAPHLGAMTFPVIVYLLAIMTMVWRAEELWHQTRTKAALLALAGAILFAASDSLLALNKFRATFEAARLLTLTAYFTAQWLIALSVRKDAPTQ